MRIKADFDINCYLCEKVSDYNTDEPLNFIKEDNDYIIDVEIKSSISNGWGNKLYFYDKEIEAIDIKFKSIKRNRNIQDLVLLSEEITYDNLEVIKDLTINSIKIIEKNEVITSKNYDFSNDKDFLKKLKKFLFKQYSLIFLVKLESEKVQE